MFENTQKVLSTIPKDAKCALTSILNVLTTDVWPEISSIKNNLSKNTSEADPDSAKKWDTLKYTFSLCCSQVVKCMLLLVEIFKRESQKLCELQESRKWVVERFQWCLKRLSSVAAQMDHTDKSKQSENTSLSEVDEEYSLFEIPLNFVNWIDHTFTLLEQLTNVLLKTDSTDNYIGVEYTDEWKYEVSELLCGLHSGVDELLMSAMTLCRYCLPQDQQVVTVRSQVVLRETKSLMKELLLTEKNDTYKISSKNLRTPLHPSTINVLLDILKESLYTLESNTNTALLSLLVDCFVDSSDPVEKMKMHFEEISNDMELSRKVGCMCPGTVEENWEENCEVVKAFDFYCECLTQIGLFAMSCSSDDMRMLSLRSGLASLEALDPHLVPSLILSPHSDHSSFLEDNWKKDIEEIRNSIFLIVDPVALVQRTKEIMYSYLLIIKKDSLIDTKTLTYVINLGKLILDFLHIYGSMEPDALPGTQELFVLLDNLKKVVNECFSAGVYSKTTNQLTISFDRMFKRLKLLYTIVTRIYNKFNNSDDDRSKNDVLEYEEISPPAINEKEIPISGTFTCEKGCIGYETQIIDKNRTNGLKLNKNNSVLIRSSIVNHSKLTKMSPFVSMKLKECINHRTTVNSGDELDFSFKIDNLFSLDKEGTKSLENYDKSVYNSILYVLKRKMSTRMSLRKEVLKKRAGSFSYKPMPSAEETSNDTLSRADSTMNLQITEILDQLMDLSTTIATNNTASKRNKITKTIVNINIDDTTHSENNNPNFSTDLQKNANISTYTQINPNISTLPQKDPNISSDFASNVLRIPVNRENDYTALEKDVWKIKIKQNPKVEESYVPQPILKLSSFCMDLTGSCSVQTCQSNITTPERLNDLDALEKKLAMLRGSNL